MNPYLRLNIKVPTLAYLYAERILEEQWPETQPVSSTPPVISAEVVEVTEPAEPGMVIVDIKIYLDGDALPIPVTGLRYLYNNLGRIYFRTASPDMTYLLSQEFVDFLLHNVFEPYSNDPFTKAIRVAATSALNAWTPPEPSAEFLAQILTRAGFHSKVQGDRNPKTLAFDPFHVYTDPKKWVVGYGVYKDKLLIAKGGADPSVNPTVMYTTPEEAVKGITASWEAVAGASRPDRPLQVSQKYIEGYTAQLKEDIRLFLQEVAEDY